MARSSAAGPAGCLSVMSSVPCFRPNPPDSRRPVAGARDRVSAIDRRQRARRLLSGTHGIVHRLQWRAGRHAQLHGKFTLRELRDQLRSQPGQHRHGEQQRADCTAQHDQPVAQRPPQHCRIALLERAE
jgi:hypothetical protein